MGACEEGGAVHLKGLAPSEARGSRVTVWYEEKVGDKLVDVPYTGTVLSIGSRDGMSVRFDNAFGADGRCTCCVLHWHRVHVRTLQMYVRTVYRSKRQAHGASMSMM